MSPRAVAGPIGRVVLAHVLAVVVSALVVSMTIAGWTPGATPPDIVPFLVLLLSALGVGWLLAARLPHNALGWILIAIPGLLALSTPLGVLAEALRPDAPGVAQWLLWYTHEDSWAWLPPIWLLLAQLPLRFPDGQLPSPRWRWFSWFTVLAFVVVVGLIGTSEPWSEPGVPNPAYVPGLAGNPVALVLGFGSLAAAFAGSVGSLFVRYRHGDAVQRAQLRWMLWAVAIAVFCLVVSWLVPENAWGQAWTKGQAWTNWILIAYALIPISIGIAVLRYRLYDIDRIISRTVSYAIVTLVAVSTYVVVVLLVALVLPQLPSVGIAVATLAAAGSFLPLLHAVRRLIDRRFDREQYDAEHVVEELGDRMRTGGDPQTAADDLLAAAERTLQPKAMGMWLSGGAR